MTTFKKKNLLFLTMLILLSPALSLSSGDSEAMQYQLAVSFDTEKSQLTGTCKITLPPGRSLTLDIKGLNITGIVVQAMDGKINEAGITDPETLKVDSDNRPRDIFISYSLDASSSPPNRIEPDGITLLESWYPRPYSKTSYHLTASLPSGFTAVAESDTFPLPIHGNTATASFASPLNALHFAAAPYAVDHLDVRDNLRVYTLFFPEDHHLAKGYLESAREYMLRYEKQIGPFPYNHYVITANKLPTGLGMPTFTLLGQSVLRLPFIKSTSLGHEILHSWFGNSVEVDHSLGNWCEGLTSYLADHAYRKDRGDAAAYRKETILNYLSYINGDNVIPLSSFYSADHSQPLAKARRAVGYSRSLMLFHELHEKIGPELFGKSLQEFYSRFRGEAAGWDDIAAVFSDTAETDLKPFFTERLERTDIPSLELEEVEISHAEDSALLRLTVVQKTDKPYSLTVPVRVTFMNREQVFHLEVSTEKTKVELELEGRPLDVVIDPQYSMIRQLSSDEKPAIWSRFLGSDKKLVVIASEQAREKYQPLLARLGDESWAVKYDSEVSNAELRDRDLLFFGTNQKSARSLFGPIDHADTGFTLEVRSNPLNHAHTAALVSSASPKDTSAVASRLAHYGKYSFLSFQNGRLENKRISDTESGQVYKLEDLPAGGTTVPLTDFHEIARQLSAHDVIYLGETHTSVSDHLLQLRMIEAVKKYKNKLAIGMEMFPTKSQDILDRYVLGDASMTEREFLKESRYFEVWKYDYRYFRDVFRFARKHKIPVAGLNLDREIVSSVFKNGSTDKLSDEQKNRIPADRDLDLPGYGKRLQEMYSVHAHSNLGSGMASGFIQAQALWDETMAQNIADYLLAHPGTTMIVLAGSQHTRKDSGIPPRVKRRLDVSQASVLNISSGSQPDNLAEVADYFFLSRPAVFSEQGKMGIILEEIHTDQQKYVKIDKFTPASKAPEAGLHEGDTITVIDGFPITSMADIRIAMVDAEPGSKISVELHRPETGEVISTEVDLIGPRSSSVHP